MAPKTIIHSCLTLTRTSAVVIAALGVTMSISAPAQAAADDEPIPTQLLNGPDIGDLNGPCSLCRVTSLKTAEETAGSEPALDIYFEDERGTLWGSIELTVLLKSGELHYLTLEEVTLAYREHTVFELPSVEEWDWNHDVRHLWVEPIPADPST